MLVKIDNISYFEKNEFMPINFDETNEHYLDIMNYFSTDFFEVTKYSKNDLQESIQIYLNSCDIIGYNALFLERFSTVSNEEFEFYYNFINNFNRIHYFLIKALEQHKVLHYILSDSFCNCNYNTSINLPPQWVFEKHEK